jgi:hypothetical protein
VGLSVRHRNWRRRNKSGLPWRKMLR